MAHPISMAARHFSRFTPHQVGRRLLLPPSSVRDPICRILRVPVWGRSNERQLLRGALTDLFAIRRFNRLF